jgi:CheY-like chemotaxis protein
MSDYVLVVDDHPDVRHLIVDVLDTMGILGREAANGEQALQMVDEKMPRAIVLDLMMPVMNGFTLLTQLYNRTPGRTIPVILLSGLADDHQMKVLSGVVGVLKKGSFTVDELRLMVNTALGDAKVAGSVQGQSSPQTPEAGDHLPGS